MQLCKPRVIKSVDDFIRCRARMAYCFFGVTRYARPVYQHVALMQIFKSDCSICTHRPYCEINDSTTLPLRATNGTSIPIGLLCHSTVVAAEEDFILLNAVGLFGGYPVLIHRYVIQEEELFDSVFAMRNMGVEKYQAVLLTARRFSE